jgi:alcohol dehydrogenase (cytochrome c)
LALLAGQSRAFAGDDLLHALKPVTDATLAKPAADDWLMRRGNFAAWGFSALDQINAQNVGRLRLAWAWNTEPGYQEEAPLAHDGVLFLANPKNVVQALDGSTLHPAWIPAFAGMSGIERNLMGLCRSSEAAPCEG